MSISFPLLPVIVYSFTLWFGLYLLARDRHKAGLRYAGLGLVSYAIALLVALLIEDTAGAWSSLPVVLPSVFWMGAVIYLVPDVPVQPINRHIVLLMIVLLVVTTASVMIRPALTRFIAAGLPVVFLIGTILRLRQSVTEAMPRPPLLILVTATIFFALGTGLILLPYAWLSDDVVMLAISLDMICLGYVVGVLDAYDEGTSLFTDALRSFAANSLAVIISGGQIVLVMAITDNQSLPMLILLIGMITTVMIALVFGDSIQSLLDHLIYSRADVRQQRDALRAASSGIARSASPLPQIDDADFTRWTRRALSHYGDLDKLAASPLLQLPLINDAATDDNVLARAGALKALLREGIDHLKPDGDADFAATDEWRYYNALYFPYVAGLKPYSSRFYRDDLSTAEADALDWFRTYVPERTLYNWQNTAAGLVAQYLREQIAASVESETVS